MNNISVVITGIIDTNIDILLNTYKSYNNKIISTWNNQNKDYIKILEENNFIIVLNDYPVNNNSTNYQIKASHAGCLKAKELGFEYVIRMRSDVNCNNFNLFIESLYNSNFFNKEKLISFSGMKYHGNPTDTRVCIMDNMIGGYINNMIEFYGTLQESGDNRFPEEYLQENYLKKNNITTIDILNKFNFCYDICKNNNITFFIAKCYNWEFINWRCIQADAWR